ncbi:cysteine dioxygenase [Mycolicibacter arupensis]|jgi:predicted metal-dependent enzyme (double-stranded beta helix superfamily)|uniref:Cysteine dioxygenase n=1 Tax=Mycolicibacter arupensis TaxID=342002 RepID=A0A5B1M8N8_9MYCO|nr:cysteine dioxygenase family protein [Mycolicibacter arupensis]KAA1429695.1 cysteine dioxygenase [Mycolicibacter arupensis]TXI53751.1 MAG: cysteine dioxygenase [Mycolicibacter arupensis]
MLIADPIALRRPASRPRSLRQPDLLQTTDLAADAVLQGRYNHLLPASGLPDDQRWFARIHGDERLDIWLISWVPGHATELHDHGDSLGALTVLSGSLDEFHWDGRQLSRRRLDAGDQAAFSRGWVHDVVWAPSAPEQGTTRVPTLSVHAYSPPLVEMSYYDVAPGNTLRRQRTELTQHPEAS